jgi:DNA-binding response OmpR family regulator
VHRILVIEDEPAIGEVCTRVLKAKGFLVDIAADGDIAESMLNERDYSLCLIDIRTPVLNGKEVYQFIINNHPRLARRVVFTTGDMLDGYTQRFIELAERPILFKPFTPDELTEAVSDALRQVVSG